jgi:hypothetical protein
MAFGTSCSGGCALGWPDSGNVASQLLAKMQIVVSLDEKQTLMSQQAVVSILLWLVN